MFEAVHAVWSAPRGTRAPEDQDLFPVDELLTMIMSSYRWHEYHGPITLFADTTSADHLDDLGLLQIYDTVRTDEIDAIDCSRYSPSTYFSLPKIVALQYSQAPVAVLDLDLYLQQPLRIPAEDEFVVAHFETLNRLYYPVAEDIHGHERLELTGFDEERLACNMAIAAFGSQHHMRRYAESALNFADGNVPPGVESRLAALLFMEQRLIAHTAEQTGTTVIPTVESVWNTETLSWSGPPPSAMFYHTWNAKKFLRAHPDAYEERCAWLVQQLVDAYPQARPLVDSISAARLVA